MKSRSAETSTGSDAISTDASQAMTAWTIGHSNLSFPAFLQRLQHHGIEAIADVRRFPGSRRQPQFSQEALRTALGEHGIAYRWFEPLGGRRRPRPDSVNTAWRNTSFRGYADYMASTEFDESLQALMSWIEQQPTALMCAEVLWWRCHRALISDALRVRGIEVIHIQDDSHSTKHPYTSPARIADNELTYAP